MPGTIAAQHRRSDWLIGVLIGILGSAYVFKDWLLVSAPSNKLLANDLDPALMHWITGWVFHVVFERGDLANFWNANQFFPSLGTLAYSDNLVGLQLVYAPLRLIGVPPLSALYGSLMGTCIAGATLTFGLLRRAGNYTRLEAALVTFAAQFTLSQTAFIEHYQLFAFQFAPSVLLALYLYLRDFHARDFGLFCGIFALAVCIAGYFAPMMGLVAIVAAGIMLIGQWRLLGLRPLFQRIGWKSAVMGGIVGAVLYVFQLEPYMRLNRNLPVQDIRETIKYSAGLLALIRGFSPFSQWYSPVTNEWGYWEYANFPGALLLIGGVAFTASAVGAWVRHKHVSARVLLSLPVVMWMTFGAIVLFSWGPALKTLPSIHLPLYYLGKFVPGVANIRAPGRFGILIGLPLAVMLIHVVRRWQTKRSYALIIAAMLTFIVVESLPQYDLYDFTVDATGDYALLAQQVQEGEPVLILPAHNEDNIKRIFSALEQLNGSTLRWFKVPVGYGSANAPQYIDLLLLDAKVQQRQASPQRLVEMAQNLDIHVILIQHSRYSRDVDMDWNNVLRRPDVDVIFQDEMRLLMRFR